MIYCNAHGGKARHTNKPKHHASSKLCCRRCLPDSCWHRHPRASLRFPHTRRRLQTSMKCNGRRLSDPGWSVPQAECERSRRDLCRLPSSKPRDQHGMPFLGWRCVQQQANDIDMSFDRCSHQSCAHCRLRRPCWHLLPVESARNRHVHR